VRVEVFDRSPVEFRFLGQENRSGLALLCHAEHFALARMVDAQHHAVGVQVKRVKCHQLAPFEHATRRFHDHLRHQVLDAGLALLDEIGQLARPQGRSLELRHRRLEPGARTGQQTQQSQPHSHHPPHVCFPHVFLPFHRSDFSLFASDLALSGRISGFQTTVERQRREIIPATGKQSVAPEKTFLFSVRTEGPDYEKEEKDLDSSDFQPL
jgi:hypothetical protein